MGRDGRGASAWLQGLPDWLRYPHFYLLVLLLAAAALLFSTMDARPTGEAWGRVTGLGRYESEEGGGPLAYVDTPAGPRTLALPRNHGCRVGMQIRLVEMTNKRGRRYSALPRGCQGDPGRAPQPH